MGQGWGLSPRVRGKRRGDGKVCAPFRSIPACAGETAPVVSSSSCAWVYPRVCGGNHLRSGGPYRASGLSPRVRGKPTPPPRHPGTGRSIPACAGETTTRPAYGPAFSVYPRVCGGNRSPPDKSTTTRGLSPRVRGKLLLFPARLRPNGSIPACAGETARLAALTAGGTVYPRVCGGNTGQGFAAVRYCGLSPRVRGKRRL